MLLASPVTVALVDVGPTGPCNTDVVQLLPPSVDCSIRTPLLPRAPKLTATVVSATAPRVKVGTPIRFDQPNRLEALSLSFRRK